MLCPDGDEGIFKFAEAVYLPVAVELNFTLQNKNAFLISVNASVDSPARVKRGDAEADMDRALRGPDKIGPETPPNAPRSSRVSRTTNR